MRRAKRMCLVLALAAFWSGGAAGALSCGGSTGREGLQTSSGSGIGEDGAAPMPDATVSANDSGLITDTFDVQIGMASPDRLLPEVQAPEMTETGAGAPDGGGPPWQCPAFLGESASHRPVGWGGPGVPNSEIPSDYNDAGNIVPARDGSICATYPWLGSPAIDSCAATGAQTTEPLLPPCEVCEDGGGIATGGSMAGASRYSLCQALYECQIRTGCGASPAGVSYCICGNDPDCISSTSPSGPCAQEELAAFEVNPQEQGAVATLLSNLIALSPTYTYFCASSLNAVWAQGSFNNCYPQDDGGSD
jgi:hypothetical protein